MNRNQLFILIFLVFGGFVSVYINELSVYILYLYGAIFHFLVYSYV